MDPISAVAIGKGAIDVVMGGLKALGIIDDPEKEAQAKALIQSSQDWFLSYFNSTISKDEPWYSPSKLFRPVCSFIMIGFYIYARLTNVDITTTDQMLIGGVVGFWFGGRTIEKVLNRQ